MQIRFSAVKGTFSGPAKISALKKCAKEVAQAQGVPIYYEIINTGSNGLYDATGKGKRSLFPISQSFRFHSNLALEKPENIAVSLSTGRPIGDEAIRDANDQALKTALGRLPGITIER